jgi:lipopolysaccharide biosynthesis glycosyltransferase
MINLYIGYDKRQPKNFEVMVKSLLKYNTELINIIPIQTDLIKEYQKPAYPNQSTSFSFSRFLVPYLNKYSGWALYMDSDMLFTKDIAELWDLRNNEHNVQVVQHKDYTCTTEKFLNQKQHSYRRKNWSSVMLFNCERCTMLTPDYVNNASASDLHELKWAESIGELPAKFNYLVGEQEPISDVSVLHYTLGTPAYHQVDKSEHHELWSATSESIS